MVAVTIRFCVPCRYQFKAIQDADAILREFGQRLVALSLETGDHGVYDVFVDGDLIFSLEKAGRFPDAQQLIDQVRARIDSAPATGERGGSR